MSAAQLSLNDPAVANRCMEVIAGLEDYLNRELPVTWIDKEEDQLCKIIAAGLDVADSVKSMAMLVGVDIPLNAPNGKAFQENFATTLKQRIAIPKKWRNGTPQGISALFRTVSHEWGHAWQDAHAVAMGKWPKSLTHSVLYLAGVLFHTKDGEEYVGKVEGDQYATSAFCVKWLTGELEPIEWSLSSIKTSYNLFDIGTTHAEDILRSHYATLQAGGIPNTISSRLTRDYFYAHAGDLKGRLAL